MLELAEFGGWDWGIVGFYFAVVTVVGFLVHRGGGTKEYFLGGRSMPTWAVAVSLVATMLSVVTFIGVPAAVFGKGGDVSYLATNIGGILAVFVVGFLFVPRLYQAGTVTIYGYLGKRFGMGAQVAVSGAFIVGRFLSSGARLFAASLPLCLLLWGARVPTFGQMVVAICLIGVVGTVYATVGGVRAVVWVDVIQFLIVVGTAVVSICFLLQRNHLDFAGILDGLRNGPGGDKLRLWDFSLDATKPYTVWAAVFGVTFSMAAAYGVDQDLAQRFLITKSARKGAVSVIASQFIGMVVVSLFLGIGLLLYLFYTPEIVGRVHVAPPKGDEAMVYPWFLIHEFPTGLAGLAIAGFFAIAQGSLDSAMNALASSVVADLWLPLKKTQNAKLKTQNGGDEKQNEAEGTQSSNGTREERAGKVTVAGAGVMMCLFAMLCAWMYDPGAHTLLDFVLGLMTFALAGMLGVFLTALFTKRGNSVSVICALVAGAVGVVMVQDRVMEWWSPFVFGHGVKLAWPWWTPVGTCLSFLVCVSGSR